MTKIPSQNQMTMLGLICRFAIYYPLLWIAVGVVLKIIGIRLSGIISFLIIVALLMYLLETFAKRNGRFPTLRETWAVILSILLIDASLQFMLGLVLVQAGQVSIKFLLLGCMVAQLINGGGVYVVTRTMRWNLEKRKLINSEPST